MKLQLSVLDRINLLSLLPNQGTFTELIHIDSINKLINISSDEATELELKNTENGGLEWKAEKETPREVKFNKEQIKVIDKLFKTLNESEQVVDMSIISLYNKWKTKT